MVKSYLKLGLISLIIESIVNAEHTKIIQKNTHLLKDISRDESKFLQID